MIYLYVCTRKVVGWSINQHMREQLVLDALIKRKGEYISMSRGGNPWDNAVIEAFNKLLKTQLVSRKHPFSTRVKARKAVFEYIEMFYNPKQLHSPLGYKSPIEYEKLLFNS